MADRSPWSRSVELKIKGSLSLALFIDIKSTSIRRCPRQIVRLCRPRELGWVRNSREAAYHFVQLIAAAVR
jgi:hypothetical protein